MLQPSVSKKPRLTSLLGRYTLDPVTGCWVWLLKIRKDGYGSVCFNGKSSQLAHKVSYELVNGIVPEGMELDHTCKNRKCINPNHLEPVPHKVNVQRGSLAKLTPTQVKEIRGKYVPYKFGIYKLAKLFNVGATTIHEIVRGETWQE
jgi:hypothetical protein